MKKQAFLNLFEELIEADPDSLTGTEEFRLLEGWSSLVAIEFIAKIDEVFGIIVEPAKLTECKTIDDLGHLLGAHLQE